MKSGREIFWFGMWKKRNVENRENDELSIRIRGPPKYKIGAKSMKPKLRNN